jgi:hypothetical protein
MIHEYVCFCLSEPNVHLSYSVVYENTTLHICLLDVFNRDCRRKYVNFYRMKLELLQKGQLVSEDILQELENMDREGDIDDILNYRTIAEQKLQVLGFFYVRNNVNMRLNFVKKHIYC